MIVADFRLRTTRLSSVAIAMTKIITLVMKVDVVVKGNIAKFSQNEKPLDLLLSTDDKILVEASPKDTVWGIGLDESSP